MRGDSVLFDPSVVHEGAEQRHGFRGGQFWHAQPDLCRGREYASAGQQDATLPRLGDEIMGDTVIGDPIKNDQEPQLPDLPVELPDPVLIVARYFGIRQPEGSQEDGRGISGVGPFEVDIELPIGKRGRRPARPVQHEGGLADSRASHHETYGRYAFAGPAKQAVE